jgi:TonB family protein
MIELVPDRPKRRRPTWLVSLALHGLGLALVVGLPILRAADEELPVPDLPDVIITFFPPGPPAGGGGARREPEPTSGQKPAPRVAEKIVTPSLVAPDKIGELPPVKEPIAEPSGPAGGNDPTAPVGEVGLPGGAGVPGGIGSALPADSLEIHEGSAPDVVAPVLVRRVAPAYPELLRLARITGSADVEAIIEVDGQVSSVRALRATHSPFGESAVSAVAAWLYRPGRVGERAVRVRMVVHVEFSLR